MPRLNERLPRWLLIAIMAASALWCGIGVIGLTVSDAGARPAVKLGRFTHDAAAGAIPWRVALHDRSAEASTAAGTIEAILAWRRPLGIGIGLTGGDRRFEFVLRGDAPAGVDPISTLDAQSLLQSAYAALPADVGQEQIAARNEFLKAITPRGALDGVNLGGLAFTLSMPVAAVVGALALVALRRRSG